MRYLMWILLALVFTLCVSTYGHCAITRVNHGFVPCADGSTTCSTPNFTEGAGDLLIFACNSTSGTGANSVGDTLGNGFTPAYSNKDTIRGNDFYNVWYSPNSKGGTNSITCNRGAGGTGLSVIFYAEYSGVASANPLEVFSTAQISDGTSSCTTPSITTTGASDLIFTVAMGNQWGGTYTSTTVSSGFSVIDDTAPAHQHGADSSRVSAAGSYSNKTTYTGGGGMNWFCGTMAFKAAVAQGVTHGGLMFTY